MSQAGMTKTLQLVIDASKATTGAAQFQHASENVTHAATDMAHGSHAAKEAFAELWEKAQELAGALGLVFTAEKAFEEATSFSDHLQKIGVTTGLAGDGLNELGEDLEKLSHKVPVTVDNMMDIARAAGQLGSKGREDVLDFTDAVSRFVAKTGEGANESATSFGQILRLSGEGVAGAQALSRETVALSFAYRATGGQILDMSKSLQLATEQFHLSAETTGVYGAVLASLGKDSTRASMGIGQAFTEIEKSIRQGGESLQDLEAVTGMTGAQLKQTFETDPPRVFRAFLEGLHTVVEGGGSADNVLSRFNLNGHMLSTTLVALSSNLDQLDKGFDVAAAGAKKPVENFDLWHDKLQLVKNDAESLGKSIGDRLLGPTDLLIQALRDLLDPEYKATEQAHSLADGIKLVGVAIGIVVAYKAATKIAEIGGALADAAGGAVKFSSAMTPVLIALTALAGFEVGRYLYDQFEEVQTAGAKTVSYLQRGWEAVKYAAIVSFDAVGSAWTGLMDWLQHKATQALSAVGEQLTKVGNELHVDSLKSAGAALQGIATGMDAAQRASDRFDTSKLLPLNKLVANQTAAELTLHKLGAEAHKAFLEGFSDYSLESHQDQPDLGNMYNDVEKMAKALESSGDDGLKAAAEALRKRRQEIFDELDHLPYDTKMKLAKAQYDASTAGIKASLDSQLRDIHAEFSSPDHQQKSFIQFLTGDVDALLKVLGMVPEKADAAKDATAKEGGAAEEAGTAHDKFNRSMDKTLKGLSDLTPEMKAAREEVERYQQKLAQGADRAGMSEEDKQLAEAMDRLHELTKKANYSPEELHAMEQKTRATVELTRENEKLRGLSNEIGQSAADDFTAFITGAKSAKNAVHDLAYAIEKELVATMVTKPAASAIGNFVYSFIGNSGQSSGGGGGYGSVDGGTSFSGGGDSFGAVAGMGGVFHNGEAISPYAEGGIAFNQATFDMGAGKTGSVAEGNIPEVIAPLARDARGRLGVVSVPSSDGASSGNSKTSVAIHVHGVKDADSFRRSSSQVAAAYAKAIRRVS